MDLLFGRGVGDDEELVAGPEPHLGGGEGGLALADDRGDDGACGEGDLGECAAGGTGLRCDGGLDHVDARFAQAQEGHRAGGAGGFLDEGDEGCGGGDCGVDAPALVEEPGIVRVVDACRDTGDGELPLGEKADDQVVLVVAGGGDDEVGGVGAGVFEEGGLAGVPGDEAYGKAALELGDAVLVDVDEGDVVAGGGEDLGDLGAQAPGACDEGFMSRVPCPGSRSSGRGRWPRRRR